MFRQQYKVKLKHASLILRSKNSYNSFILDIDQQITI